jgi:hypothetical protein
VFVHGFGGDTSEAWGDFAYLLMEDPQLTSWGILGLGLASSIWIDVPGIWAADAGSISLAALLLTALSIPLFD